MADTIFDTTGVLMLDKVTPVIKAIYGGYNLDVDYPGKCYIALTQHGGDSSWSTVIESLSDIALSKGLEAEKIPSNIEILNFLGKIFEVDENEDFNQLLENESFTEEATLDALYLLANFFDDGHGLCGYLTESAWTCSRPRIFEFGGCGFFQGKHYVCTSNSSHALDLGNYINRALSNNDLQTVAARMKSEVEQLLDGVVDENQRIALKVALLKELQQS